MDYQTKELREEVKRVRDYVELANSLDPDLPNMKQREIVCDALLEDLKNLKGKDLAPYLSE